MQMPTELQAAMSDHITSEKFAESTYEAMGIAFDAMNWLGFSKWARGQASDELDHARKFIDYLNDRNVPGAIGAIPSPATPPVSVLLCFHQMLALEKMVTGQIETLYTQAEELEDDDVCRFLLWFLEEQTQSEKDLTVLIGRISRADNATLEKIDEQLGGE
jgi:ferritin